MKLSPSIEPVVEKAQQDPQLPWFLTGVTAPAVTQLTDVAKLESSNFGIYSLIFYSDFFTKPRRVLNSASVRSANEVIPNLKVDFPLS